MRIEPLANNYIEVLNSKIPETLWTCSPGLCICPNRKLIATCGLRGPGIDQVKGTKSKSSQGLVFISDDHGDSWKKVAEYPFQHARPFIAGDKLYVLGHDGDLMIMVSEDWGESWSKPCKLTSGQSWHQAPCNVLYENNCVYLVMEREIYDDCQAWTPSVLAPVLMRGNVNDDLTLKENWTFASEIAFRDVFDDEELISQGRHFYPIIPKKFYHPVPECECAPPGWLETNVFKIYDPNHYWYDPENKTIHMIARFHCGMTNYAALIKARETGSIPGIGDIVTDFQKLPSGGTCHFMQFPGGQMKFHVLYDEVTKLYWLLNTQATDSMTRADKLPSDRYNLPNNQRTRLVLHFSQNMVDWCFAGLVAVGETEIESRHYASMVIDGDDLCILSRSGDHRAKSAHNGNLITFHKVTNFRELVY